ncbi:antifungal protein ginkbilobin-like protein [Cicer arietinum]|uniref:Antifungal protein ginkbilobin-like protein n=1 Tax=Cicer arietinum TaxID=3827 RepID=A0A1S2XU64_CICAR|nr:antifungal protein ginkbilobin-like protein [Cicer arietinum]
MNMNLPQRHAPFLLVLLCLCNIAKGVPNTNIRNVLCNSGKFTRGDPFTISLSFVLEDLENETPTQTNYDYLNISPYPNAFAYGHATCNLNLTSFDCKTCLGVAKLDMFSTCQTQRIGARSLLHDCSLRYEQYPFDD